MNNSNWWADKLGTTPAPSPRQDPTPQLPPSQQPMAQMPVFQPQVPQPSKAMSANQNAQCPNCWSNNYFAATAQTSLRCYDCGYPVQQSGSAYGSLAGATVQGAAIPANGNSGTNGFSPIPDGYGSNGQRLG